MGLLTIIQISCHHVLANQNSLKFRKGAPLQQIFNINLEIGIIKKLLFLFVFSTYLFVYLLKFRLGDLIGCGIKFNIQRVPTLHTIDGPYYPKNKKYLKKYDDDIIIMFFQVFLVLGVVGSIKSMSSGYWLDVEFISASKELSQSKFEEKHKEICRKYEQKK